MSTEPTGGDRAGIAWSRSQIAASAVLLAALLVMAAVAFFGRGRAVEDEITVSPPGKAQAAVGDAGAAAPAGPIMVHVIGAVVKPGVVTLQPGARTQDAVVAAGGPAPEADLQAINLAERLDDGRQLVVPKKGDAAAPQARPVAVAASRGRGSSGDRHEGPKKLRAAGEGTVDINSASAEELQRLPGIGPSMAARIMEHRRQSGKFTAAEQLMDVSGIGEKTFAKMQPFIRVR
ncbi:MAG: helix-hairpin-helix domain-containing protein [Armatimonadetes bacterium]|nr:helix-hairpin-helix domain-containing protein [Armatimonadota bacterium]